MASNHPFGSDEAAAPSTGDRKRKSSDVWLRFRSTGGGKAACKTCGLTLSAGGAHGTSHLRRHLATRRCAARAAAVGAGEEARTDVPQAVATPSILQRNDASDDAHFEDDPDTMIQCHLLAFHN